MLHSLSLNSTQLLFFNNKLRNYNVSVLFNCKCSAADCSVTCFSPQVLCWPFSWIWAKVAAAAPWQCLCLLVHCSREKNGMWCSLLYEGRAEAGFWLFHLGWSSDLRGREYLLRYRYINPAPVPQSSASLSALTANVCIQVADSKPVFSLWAPGNPFSHQIKSPILFSLTDLLHHQQHFFR